MTYEDVQNTNDNSNEKTETEKSNDIVSVLLALYLFDSSLN
jgi:hypothetical protein